MTKYYLGVQQVMAYPVERDGVAGQQVTCPDGASWFLPEAEFQRRYLELGETDTLSEAAVDRMLAQVENRQLGNRTVAATLHLRSGYELTRLANCAEEQAMDAAKATEQAQLRAFAAVWEFLGAVQQWAKGGLRPARST